MSSHNPRFRLYPQHADYYRMYPAYRPFIFWINEPSYRSPSVNTDELGLRLNTLPAGGVLEVSKMKKTHPECDVLIGGSTVFGVDASSDRTTISALLSSDGVPCINLGNRGAVGYQELQLFLFYRTLFPKIRNIIVLSGVNDCSLASLDGSIVYEEFGGVFGQDQYMAYPYLTNLSVCYDDRSYDRLRLYNALERRYRDDSLFRGVFRAILRMSYKREPMRNLSTDKRAGFDRKVERQMGNLANQLFVWKSLADAHGAGLHYFLQPCIGWTGKALSRDERSCHEIDLEVHPEMLRYANPEFHKRYSSFIRAACSDLRIPFHDTNSAFDERGEGDTLFTDVCHLTDEANRIVADHIRSRTTVGR